MSPHLLHSSVESQTNESTNQATVLIYLFIWVLKRICLFNDFRLSTWLLLKKHVSILIVTWNCPCTPNMHLFYNLFLINLQRKCIMQQKLNFLKKVYRHLLALYEIIKPGATAQHYWGAVRLLQISFIREFRNKPQYCLVDRQLIFCMWFPTVIHRTGLWNKTQDTWVDLMTFDNTIR